jgi:hypothetical protein
MESNNHNELIEIFSGSAIEAEIVKSILKDSEIESFLKDEYMGTIAPWQTAPGGLGSVKVTISSLDYEQAKTIVENFKNSK